MNRTNLKNSKAPVRSRSTEQSIVGYDDITGHIAQNVRDETSPSQLFKKFTSAINEIFVSNTDTDLENHDEVLEKYRQYVG